MRSTQRASAVPLLSAFEKVSLEGHITRWLELVCTSSTTTFLISCYLLKFTTLSDTNSRSYNPVYTNTQATAVRKGYRVITWESITFHPTESWSISWNIHRKPDSGRFYLLWPTQAFFDLEMLILKLSALSMSRKSIRTRCSALFSKVIAC